MTTMQMSNPPRHHAYTPVVTHTCERCGTHARIVFSTKTPGAYDDFAKSTQGWAMTPFADGAVAIAPEHHSAPGSHYFWGGQLAYCGMRVLVGDPLPDTLINSLYRDLYRWEEPNERIESFDLAKFVAAPFTAFATSPDAPPLLLVANPIMLRHYLITGTMPDTNAGATQNINQSSLVAARTAFIEQIGAVVRPLA